MRSRTQAGRDITSEFSSPRRRLADALAERRGLLRRLARAATPNETAAVRARLRAVNRRIDRNRADAALACVSGSRSPQWRSPCEPGGTAEADGGWTLGDAARDALSVLGAVAGATIIALAVALPAGILALGAWLAYRALARRRRERALDAPRSGSDPGVRLKTDARGNTMQYAAARPREDWKNVHLQKFWKRRSNRLCYSS